MMTDMNRRGRGQTTGYRLVIAIPTAIIVGALALVAYGLGGASGYSAAAAETVTPSYGGLYALMGVSLLALALVVALATWQAVRPYQGGADA
jgi:hypothetical protein